MVRQKLSETLTSAAPDDPHKQMSYTPTEQEAASLKAFQARGKVSRPVPRISVKQKGSTTELGADHPDPRLWWTLFLEMMGTVDTDFAKTAMTDLARLNSAKDGSIDTEKLNGLFAAVAGIAPKNETEALLAIQMVATHVTAMECLKRASLAEQSFEGP